MRLLSALLLVLLFAWHAGAGLMHASDGLWYTSIGFGFAEPFPGSEAGMYAIDVAFSNPWIGPVQLAMSALRAIAAVAVLVAAGACVSRRRGTALAAVTIAFVSHALYAPVALYVLWTLEVVYGTAFLDTWAPIVGELAYDLTSLRLGWVPWIALSLLTSPGVAGLIWVGAAPEPEATDPER